MKEETDCQNSFSVKLDLLKVPDESEHSESIENNSELLTSISDICEHHCLSKGSDGRLHCECGKSFVMA